MGGDININILDDSPLCRDTLWVLESNACINTITVPTRIQGNCESLRDVFFTNSDAQNIESGAITAHISDRLHIFLLANSFVLPSCLSRDQHFTFQDNNLFTLDKFCNEILRINWQDVHNEKGCDKVYKLYLSFFQRVPEMVQTSFVDV